MIIIVPFSFSVLIFIGKAKIHEGRIELFHLLVIDSLGSPFRICAAIAGSSLCPRRDLHRRVDQSGEMFNLTPKGIFVVICFALIVGITFGKINIWISPNEIATLESHGKRSVRRASERDGRALFGIEFHFSRRKDRVNDSLVGNTCMVVQDLSVCLIDWLIHFGDTTLKRLSILWEWIKTR